MRYEAYILKNIIITLLFNLGEYDKAVPYINRILLIAGEYPDFYYYLGYAMQKLNNENYENFYHKALELLENGNYSEIFFCDENDLKQRIFKELKKL